MADGKPYCTWISNHVIRSDYADIMVKVDKDVYHLDRLQLILQSDYFEKLFTEDFYEKKCDLVELHIMDSNTFNVIVDVMYGKKLKSVLTDKNCVSLLMAMDYLQMDIDLKKYAKFMKKNYSKYLLSNGDIFKLYNFVSENRNFKPLLSSIFKYFSLHLNDARDRDEFLLLPAEHFIEVIRSGYLPKEHERVRKFSRICVEWICYDVEDRFRHVGKLLNAVRDLLGHPHRVKKESLDINLDNISQKMKRKKILSYFQRLLLYQGEIKPVSKKSKSSRKESFRRGSRDKNKRSKLAKFLENGDFYDITVKVEEKTYRLHRFKLRSACAYFADFFSAELTAKKSSHPEGTLLTPISSNKHDDYLITGIDHTTFEMMIGFIYLDRKIEFTSDNLVSVLKADKILKIKGLQRECASWLERNIEQINAELAAEICYFTYGNKKFDDFHKLYFRKRVSATWPESGDNAPLFRSITFKMLEKMLLMEMVSFTRDELTIPDFCFDDRHKLLDICSKWIMHDVEKRYHLIPRIALAINYNYAVDYDDYKEETPRDFSYCSQRFVRDRLWEILCSTALVRSTNGCRKIEAEPVFIVWTSRNKISILNADLDPIASLSCFEEKKHEYFTCSVSAAVRRDNVFILVALNIVWWHPICFHAYNLSLKKFVSLAPVPARISKDERQLKFTLLNCRNEIHCCSNGSEYSCILRYSIELNRWTRLSKSEPLKSVQFASEGEKLYRMYRMSDSSQSYAVDVYNFEQNLWSAPNLSLHLGDDFGYSLLQLTFVNDCRLAALFESTLCLFNYRSQTWERFQLANRFPACVSFGAVAHSETDDEILHVFDNKLYHFSTTNLHWYLKKEVSSKSYSSVVAIHAPERSDARHSMYRYDESN